MMRAYRFYITAGLLILFIFLMVTMTVNATEAKKLQHKNMYYEKLEDEYKVSLRDALAQKGYRNAGITMTKVFYENGECEYTVKLHHKRMSNLSETERNRLLENLSNIEFVDSECKVYLKFL